MMTGGVLQKRSMRPSVVALGEEQNNIVETLTLF